MPTAKFFCPLCKKEFEYNLVAFSEDIENYNWHLKNMHPEDFKEMRELKRTIHECRNTLWKKFSIVIR